MAKHHEIKLCHHVKANGTCCESPALRDQDYCFFHVAQRQRVRRTSRAARLQQPFSLPLLEDIESVQLAISDTLNAIVTGQIDAKTAGLLLSGLRTAARIAKTACFKIYESDRRFSVYHEREADLLEQEIAEDVEQEEELARIAAWQVQRERQAETPAVMATGESGSQSGFGVKPPSVPAAQSQPAPALPAKKPVASVTPEPTNANQAVGETPAPTAPKLQSRSDGMK